MGIQLFSKDQCLITYLCRIKPEDGGIGKTNQTCLACAMKVNSGANFYKAVVSC